MMVQADLIQVLDPNPLSGPYAIVKLLLIVTFFLHVLAMNFMIGGAVLAIASRWRHGKRGNGNRISFDVAKKLPVFLPAVISLGVAPALFMQVFNEGSFYPSSILMAWPWSLLVVLLSVAYYGFYFVSFRSRQQPGRAGIVTLVSVILVAIIGFMFSNNLTLSRVLSRLGAKYFTHPSGWQLTLSEPTLIPRFLHFFVSAVAVGGLLLVFVSLANWKRDREYARQLLRFGGRAFMYATMAQFLVGVWFLVSLPRDWLLMFTGSSPTATAILMVGIFGSAAAIFVMSDAVRKENIRAAAYLVPTLTVIVIFTMCIARDMLRDANLRPYHTEQFVSHTQWPVVPLILALLFGGVVLRFVMLKLHGLFSSAGAAEIVLGPALLQQNDSSLPPSEAPLY